jgi:hypothetical protein
MKIARETSQSMQRVKVGMIGLCAVVLLIALTSVIMGSVARERGTVAAEQARSDVASNVGMVNQMEAPVTGEPLAELGVSPGANTQAPAK